MLAEDVTLGQDIVPDTKHRHVNVKLPAHRRLRCSRQQGEICSGVMQLELDGARWQQSKQRHRRHVGLQSDQHVGAPASHA